MNYMQPDFRHGAYTPTPVYTSCPLCSAGNVATAQMVGSGSYQWRCDNGHRFTQASYKSCGPFLPVFDEPAAEVRIPLTTLQKFRG